MNGPKNTCNWDLKFINKIGLKINVKIKLGQILGSTVSYASVVGSLMYVMACTRPDIAHAVEVVSRFLSNPGKEHWVTVKWILKHLRGTPKTWLCFGTNKPMLVRCTNVDMVGDIDSRKSTSGYLITFFRGSRCNLLLLIVEVWTRLGPVVFPFALRGFPCKYSGLWFIFPLHEFIYVLLLVAITYLILYKEMVEKS